MHVPLGPRDTKSSQPDLSHKVLAWPGAYWLILPKKCTKMGGPKNRFFRQPSSRSKTFPTSLSQPQGCLESPELALRPLWIDGKCKKWILSPYTHCTARWAAPVQVHGPTAGARGWKPSGGMPGGRPGRRGAVGRPPCRRAQRAVKAPAKGDKRTRASRARRPRPFTNRSEMSPTARPGVGGHEGLPGLP